MLPPGGILEAPGQVAAASPRSARATGIKVADAQTMCVVELVVGLSEILIEIVGGRNIALPSRVAVRERNVGRGYKVSEDPHRHRIHPGGADYVRYPVADER